MGLFSWDCLGCNRSIRSPYTRAGKGDWMSQATHVSVSGSISGKYDGYGRIETPDYNDDDDDGLGDGAWWHTACWEHAGKPGYAGDSPHAHDQGHFIGPEASWWPPGMEEHRLEDGRLFHTRKLAYLEACAEHLRRVITASVDELRTLGALPVEDAHRINEHLEPLDALFTDLVAEELCRIDAINKKAGRS